MAAYTNIDDPSAHFQTALYTGNGSTQSITNDGNSDMQPDWIWLKSRSVTASHNSYDSSRGTGKHLAQNTTDAEVTYHGVTAFNSDGFTISSGNDMNYNNATFVAWQWKANGGTTASNSNGSITSTVQANQDAGFSIVTYTGTGASAATVGHGLGVAPKIILGKRRSGGSNWWVGGSILGDTQTLYLNLTNAIDNVTGTVLQNTTTSTTFKLGTDTNRNQSSGTHVAYCFAEKQGYSKFGKYVGNGNANGPFVYTGFKPAFVMMKPTSYVEEWVIIDAKRDPNNQAMLQLKANSNGPEYNGAGVTNGIDILSNGFKVRTSRTELNTSGGSLIYMAFAEQPFVTSTGVPATAR